MAKNTAVYLQTQLGEYIKLCELIVKIGTHRSQLNDAFKTRYGLTVFAWLLKKRMSLALTLLKTTTLSILQVGDQVGYPDSIISQPHLSVSINYRLGITDNCYLRSICAPNKGIRG